MATEGEFLRLLQMTEGVRRCEHRDSLGVTEGHVEQGKAVEAARSAHVPDMGASGHERATCVECQAIAGQSIALRETMHSEGIDFPLDLLAS